MKYYSTKQTSGFTLIEILVVVAIIALLASAVLFAVSQARQQSRDKFRVNTFEQLKLGYKLMIEDGTAYPNVASGIELGRGGRADASIKTILPNLKADPLSNGRINNYAFWYDSNFRCSTAGQKVIITRMESTKNANFNAVCIATSPGPNGMPNGWGNWTANNMYVVILP